MVKKSAISGEYIITIEDNNSVRVCRIYDNVIGSLREICEKEGMEIDPKWNTQQLGREVIKRFGEGTMAEVGEYVVTRRPSGSIETYRTFANTMGALREIAAKIGFEILPKWNTQDAGRKIVDFINANK